MQLRKICQHPFLFESVEDKISPGGFIDDKLIWKHKHRRPRACVTASQLAQARAETAKVKETLQRAEEPATTEQTAHSRLRAPAAHNAELFAQHAREVDTLRASPRENGG